MMGMAMWQQATFAVATPKGVVKVHGTVARGIGMHVVRAERLMHLMDRGPRALTAIVHLGSGHAICLVDASYAKTAEIATQIIDAGDWEFDGLKGWENMDPTLSLKVQAICNRHMAHIRSAIPESDDFQARKIALERA